MLSLDEEVVVMRDGRAVHRARVPRTIATMARTLAERGDPAAIYSAEVIVE